MSEVPSEIVLGRVGHYHIPNAGHGTCQVGFITNVDSANSRANLVVFTHDGEMERRHAVPVGAVSLEASFHLTRDCEFGR